MAKKNKVKVGKKKKAAPKKAGPKTKTQMSLNTMAKVMETCSITNPFCPEADNGKWPDNSYVKSNTWNISGMVYDLVTNGGGDAAVLFLPMQICQYSTGTCIGNAVTTGTTGGVLQTVPTSVNRWRITSMGFKISCATPAMTTQGFCNIRGFSTMAMATLATYDKTDRLADFAEDIPLHRLLDQDAFIVPIPLGDDAREWRSAPAYTTTWQSFDNVGWQVISVGVSGGIASTSCLRVECFYHYEFIFSDGNSAAAFATPPPKNDIVVREASAGVIERIGGVVRGTAKTIENIANSKAFQYIAAAGASYASKSPAPMLMLANGSGGRQNAKYVD